MTHRDKIIQLKNIKNTENTKKKHEKYRNYIKLPHYNYKYKKLQ